LSATFDEKSKNSKLLILISDGEDHSEGAQAAAEEANRQGMKLLQ
jgi:Ca-activated chloride channel family protein